MKKILLTTIFNNKKFIVYEENNDIGYVKLNNLGLSYDIEKEDRELLDKVYDSIKYNEDTSIFHSNIKFNGNLINIYQDTRNNLYSFTLVDNGHEVMPNLKDLIKLNSYFNADREVFFNDENKEKKTKKPLKVIKKTLKIGGVTVVILLSTTISYFFLPQNTRTSIDYNMGNLLRKDITKENKNYTIEDINNVIDSNNSIPDEDKKFYKEIFKSELEENKDYIDLEMVINKLKNLDVSYSRYYTYDSETGEYKYTYYDNLQGGVVAFYSSDNSITLIEPENCYEDDTNSAIEKRLNETFTLKDINKEIYFHELNHMLTYRSVDGIIAGNVKSLQFLEANDIIRTDSGIFELVTDDLGQTYASDIYMETINELFSQEYSAEYLESTIEMNTMAYTSDMPYMYALAEILPNDVLREYKFNNNDSIIVEGLLDINNNKTEVYEFTTALKAIHVYDTRVFRAKTNNDLYGEWDSSLEEEIDKNIEQAELEREENYVRIHDGFAEMYKAKYGKDMSNDMNMLVYLYNTPILTEEERKKVTDYLSIPEGTSYINFEPKGYFSNYYKEKHPNIVYINKDNQKIEITEDNRYLESNINSSTRHV